MNVFNVYACTHSYNYNIKLDFTFYFNIKLNLIFGQSCAGPVNRRRGWIINPSLRYRLPEESTMQKSESARFPSESLVDYLVLVILGLVSTMLIEQSRFVHMTCLSPVDKLGLRQGTEISVQKKVKSN